MPNPFTPSFGVTPPLLVGRDEALADFRMSLDAGPGDPGRAILLTGVRGSGKTVLLNAFEDEARQRGWVVISETTRPGVVEELTGTGLPQALAAATGGVADSTLTGLTVTAAGFGGGVTRERSERYPVTPSLRSQLTQLADLQDVRGAGVLVSLDEVHLEAAADLRQIAQTVQHLFREGRQVAFAAAGLPSAVDDLLSDAVLTFLRRAERFSLGSVSAQEVSLALREPIENFGREITDEALSIATAGTQGYPFLIQLVGFQMWVADPAAEVIDQGQARLGVERAARRVGRLVHEPALSRLSDVDRSFLAAMAQDDDASRLSDVARRLGVTGTYAGQYRLRLIAAELVVPAGHGRVRFALPYLRDYLRDHAATAALDPAYPGDA